MTENLPTEPSKNRPESKWRDSRSPSSDCRILPTTDSQTTELQGDIDEEDGDDDNVSELGASVVGDVPDSQDPQSKGDLSFTKSRSIQTVEKGNQITDRHIEKRISTPPKPATPDNEEKAKRHAEESSPKKEKVSSDKYPIWKYLVVYSMIIIPVMALTGHRYFSNGNTAVSSTAKIKQGNWRNYIDSNGALPSVIRSNIRAALKPISASAVKENTVATLIILSEDEKKAADLGRCLLSSVNSQSKRNELIPEVDFRNDEWTKLKIDEHLQAVLKPDETILGVLIRNIDHLSSKHALERARLLFSYCDGENPKIPHRLIIMTATVGEDLRKRFAAAWTNESDFIDPLMARINGTTITIEADQKPIC